MLLEIVKQLIDGGINFIKEDEIMANPASCPIEERVPKIMKIIENSNVIYAVCISGDSPYLLQRAQLVNELGGNAVHINWWSGLGSYKAVRELDLPLFIHFQKSGDKIFTNKHHRFRIDWKVVCDLAGLMGADFIHSGMWGGYLSDTNEDIQSIFDILHSIGTVPVLSCGMHPGLIEAINSRFGISL